MDSGNTFTCTLSGFLATVTAWLQHQFSRRTAQKRTNLLTFCTSNGLDTFNHTAPLPQSCTKYCNAIYRESPVSILVARNFCGRSNSVALPLILAAL